MPEVSVTSFLLLLLLLLLLLNYVISKCNNVIATKRDASDLSRSERD